MVEVQTTKVFFAPTKGRRYLTKRAAIHNEAVSIIYKYHPRISEVDEYEGSYCTYPGEHWDIREDKPEYFERRYNQLVKALKAKFNNPNKE